MMNKKEYSSSIKKTPFKYPIAKKIAKLMLNGFDRNQVYRECFDNNYVEIESKERRREVTNVVYNRLIILDNTLLSEFYNGDVATSKFILSYAIAKTDLLFFEFLFEIYREALVGERHYLTADDFDNFFNIKKENNIVVSGWSSDTIEDLIKGYRNIIVDSGLGERDKRMIRVSKMLIHPSVEEHISLCGDKEYLQAMLGGDAR